MKVNMTGWVLSLVEPIVGRILTALGVGVVSYAALSTVLNQALGAAKSAMGGLSGDALGLVQLAGVPDAMSIIAGALMTRVSLMVLKRFELIA